MTPLDGALALDARQHGAVMIGQQLHFDVARTRETPLEIDRESPKAAPASDRAARIAEGSSAALLTTRMPLPPPPATAFTMTGNPICARRDRRSPHRARRRRAARRCPGTTGTPAAIAARRAAVLLPISAIASGVGPMNVSPASRHAAAKSSFSDRKP